MKSKCHINYLTIRFDVFGFNANQSILLLVSNECQFWAKMRRKIEIQDGQVCESNAQTLKDRVSIVMMWSDSRKIILRKNALSVAKRRRREDIFKMIKQVITFRNVYQTMMNNGNWKMERDHFKTIRLRRIRGKCAKKQFASVISKSPQFSKQIVWSWPTLMKFDFNIIKGLFFVGQECF